MTIQAYKRLEDALTRTLQQFFCVTHVDKSTRDDIRACQGLSRLFVYGEHGQQYSVLCQHLAITHDDLPHVTYSKAVYKDVAARTMIHYLHSMRRVFYDIAMLRHDTLIGMDTHGV